MRPPPPPRLLLPHAQLRRMYALLPEALGRDQPGALAHVVAHFRKHRDWDFASLAQVLGPDSFSSGR